MNILFIGDIHGGHDNIIKFRTQFASEQDHFDYCAENYNKKVGKRDTVYFMGDSAFTKERLLQIKGWNGAKKILILGNHDTERLHIKDFIEVFDDIHGAVKYKDFWLTHIPIHHTELRGKMNIHGHTHNAIVPDHRYFNVCPEQTNYTPVSLDEIRGSAQYRKFYEEKLNAN